MILTLETRSLGTLVYDTDEFPHWHDNLRGIALGLEALRKVERYGIAKRGQQYAGFAELGSGIPMGPLVMSVDDAIALLGLQYDPMPDADDVSVAYRDAVKMGMCNLTNPIQGRRCVHTRTPQQTAVPLASVPRLLSLHLRIIRT